MKNISIQYGYLQKQETDLKVLPYGSFNNKGCLSLLRNPLKVKILRNWGGIGDITFDMPVNTSSYNTC